MQLEIINLFPGLLAYGSLDIKEGEKIIAFDLDHTLIRPKSGSVHPKDSDDWEWNSPNVPIKLRELAEQNIPMVIFTNQAGMDKGKLTPKVFGDKLNKVFTDLGFPITIFASTIHNKWRKPSPALWELFVQDFAPDADVAQCAYIGDAAGRFKDFSADDNKFARNCKLKFLTPEQYFDNQIETEPIEAGWFQGYDAFLAHQTTEAHHFEKPFAQEMILLCGPPGCGKTTIKDMYFAEYVWVNQDTINNGKSGSKAKCLKYARENVNSGKSVIIDKTLPDMASRGEFISIALLAKIPVRCIWIDLPIPMCIYLNKLRGYTGGHIVPQIAYAMFTKKYTPPKVSEGFSEVIHIDKLFIDEKLLPKEVTRIIF